MQISKSELGEGAAAPAWRGHGCWMPWLVGEGPRCLLNSPEAGEGSASGLPPVAVQRAVGGIWQRHPSDTGSSGSGGEERRLHRGPGRGHRRSRPGASRRAGRRGCGWRSGPPSDPLSLIVSSTLALVKAVPLLQAAHGHVRASAEMIRTLGGARRPQRLQHVRADDLPAFRVFTSS